MSTPIDFDDIQVRDTVTRDYRGVSSTLTVAMRGAGAVYPNFSGRADDVAVRNPDGSTWRLVDRPIPNVELPTEPTLGWLDSTGNDHALGIWRRAYLTGGNGFDNSRGDGHNALSAEITAFTPATAVPTDALDELREKYEIGHGLTLIRRGSVSTFLAAVDAANGPNT